MDLLGRPLVCSTCTQLTHRSVGTAWRLFSQAATRGLCSQALGPGPGLERRLTGDSLVASCPTRTKGSCTFCMAAWAGLTHDTTADSGPVCDAGGALHLTGGRKPESLYAVPHESYHEGVDILLR